MNFSIAQFTRVAQSNWFNNDILVSQDGRSLTSKFFHTKSSKPSAQVTNQTTRDAFQKALVKEFGDYGQQAFNTLLQTRGGKSLRKNDVLKTVRAAESAKARAEGDILPLAEKAVEKILSSKAYSYHPLPDDLKANVRTVTMDMLKTMMMNEASLENILREIKGPSKFLEGRMAILVKSAVVQVPDANNFLLDLQAEIPEVEWPEEIIAERQAKGEAKPEAKPEAKVAQPEVKSEAKVAQPEVKIEAKVAQPEVKVVQPEVKAEAKSNVNKSEEEKKSEHMRLRNELLSHFDEAWETALKEPTFVISRVSKQAQKLHRQLALAELEERMKDDVVLKQILHSYEKDPKTLSTALYIMSIRMGGTNLDEILVKD